MVSLGGFNRDVVISSRNNQSLSDDNAGVDFDHRVIGEECDRLL